jgi:hypothetical protein
MMQPSKLLKSMNLVAVTLFALACADSVAPTVSATGPFSASQSAQSQQKRPKCDNAKPNKHGCATVSAETPPDTTSDTTTRSPATTWVAIPPTVDPAGKKVKGVRWNSARIPTELSVTGTIGPAGGVLTIPGSDFMIYFPVGAVSAPTAITIVSKESDWVTYDMLPHGLLFAKPVYVTQGLAQTSVYGTPAAFSVFGAYLSSGNESISVTNDATAAETTFSFVFSQGTVRVATWSVWLLNHFSRYILASG